MLEVGVERSSVYLRGLESIGRTVVASAGCENVLVLLLDCVIFQQKKPIG